MAKCNYPKFSGTDLVSPCLYIYKNSEESWTDSLDINGTSEIMFFTFPSMVAKICKDGNSRAACPKPEFWSQLKRQNTGEKKKKQTTESFVQELSVHRGLTVTNSFVSHSYLRSALCSHHVVYLCSLFFCNSCLHLHFISLVLGP